MVSGMQILSGTVIKGINNIYTVLADHNFYLCRIKGKKLKEDSLYYNPLAPGDRVSLEVSDSKSGMITERKPRTNAFVRWNMKRNLPQIIAANLDELFCITSPDNPPFRPRFIDRVIVCAGSMPVTIIMNKCDLPVAETVAQRLSLYEELGYKVLYTSMKYPDLLDEVRKRCFGKRVAMFGQSGVGKSTLINALIPDAEQRTGAISDKYNRGRHVTNYSVEIDSGDYSIIDTPGVREIQVPHMEPYLLGSHFPEIEKLQNECSFQPCLHKGEPNCAVFSSVEKGLILPDRYESYLRILDSLEERTDYGT